MANLNAAWCRALMEELHLGGVRFSVVCPGSRSTPLALASASHPGIRTFSVVDERSAAFFALGLAKGGEAPVVVICTSGTAGAHFLPAIIEAKLTHVPLIVITADRPPELHGWGALQSIDQQHLFGRYPDLFVDLGVPEASDAAFKHLRASACRAIAIKGVTHFNAPFREPLAPIDEPGLTLPASAQPSSSPFISVIASASVPDVSAVIPPVTAAKRGLILVGPRLASGALPSRIFDLAEHLGFPIVAESTSQCRWHPDARMVISRMDALVRHAPAANALRPDVILRFGGPVTTRQIQSWIDSSGAHITLFDAHGDAFDPNHSAQLLVTGDPERACGALMSALPRRELTEYARAFIAADRIAGEALEAARSSSLTEPSLIQNLPFGEVGRSPGGGSAPLELFLSSSMPIRDFDAFSGTGTRNIRIHCNRGAAGIDGIPSTALGISASTNNPTILLTGDLSFIHDMNGLLTARRYGIPLVVILVNNDGGGIFSFLPVAQFRDHFEELFGTPHGLDFSHAAALHGAHFHRPSDVSALKEAVTKGLEGGLHIIEVRTDRASNGAVHDALWKAVSSRLGSGPWQ